MLKQSRCILILGILTLLLSGCSQEMWTVPSMIGEVDLSIDPESLEVDYEVPKLHPNIFVKLNGYDVTEKKKVALLGDVLPKEALLYIKKQDGREEVVGRYPVIDKRNEGNAYLGFVDFSEVSQPGEYQIKAGPLGESYSFQIANANYSNSIGKICMDMEEIMDPKSAYILLEAYELFPNAFKDDWALENGSSNLLTLIGDFIEKNDFEKDPYWAALLAKYALIMEGNKSQSDVHQRAKIAIGNLADISKPTDGYACLHTESYRLTGLETEGSLMTEYYRMKLAETELLNESDFLGALVYMNTRRDIDVPMSGKIMKSVIRKSEEILDKYKGNMMINMAEDEYDQILDDAMVLSTVNHIIPAYEYGNVVDRQYDFLCGRNIYHKTLEIKENPVQSAKMVYITAQLATIDDVVIDLFAQEN